MSINKNKKYLLLIILILISFSYSLSSNRVIFVKNGDDLQKAIIKAASGDTIKIGEGEFTAIPKLFIEEECGNCIEHRTKVYATTGFVVEGKKLFIIGTSPIKTKLITSAGYGFLFFNSPGSTISNLTITGGIRDTCQNATNAGIVVKKSIVTVKNVYVINNDNKAENVIVGISGIIGREDSELIIEKSIIRNNSWDGIALYRGATALIIDNIIEQGRGAGIGITWDAHATVLRNKISYYWKGIGTFGTTKAIVKNNSVFENLGWGIVITGSSFMEAANNVITANGNCGLAIWDSSASGKIYNNVITNNGWRDEWVCPQVGFWVNGDSEKVEFGYNNVWNNIMGNYRNISDLTGVNGNVSIDPKFLRDSNFKTDISSPLRNTGLPSVKNKDRKRSHMGIEGGPFAR